MTTKYEVGTLVKSVIERAEQANTTLAELEKWCNTQCIPVRVSVKGVWPNFIKVVLSWRKGSLYINDIPFIQASIAERIRASTMLNKLHEAIMQELNSLLH